MAPGANELSGGFEAFSLLHGAMAGVFTGVMGAVVAAGRRLRGRPLLPRLEVGLGVVELVLWVLYGAYWLTPARFNWGQSLPLQLCDLASLAAPVALISRARWARTLLYFWGLGLCSQAFITPTLREGPGSLYFWIFWSQHGVIVGGAIYEAVVRGYRPRAGDWMLAIAVTVGFVGFAFALDIGLGANYGYVGASKPGAPTVIDQLGAWPGRVILVGLLGMAAFGAAWLPWELMGGAEEAET